MIIFLDGNEEEAHCFGTWRIAWSSYYVRSTR